MAFTAENGCGSGGRDRFPFTIFAVAGFGAGSDGVGGGRCYRQ